MVVPAYNEAGIIGHCLNHLEKEIDSIHEVIVVDNNSVDETRSIVEQFVARDPRFRLETAKEQGLVPARNAGFDSATGDILARIDSDTRVGEGWADAVASFFAAESEEYGGGTGLCTMYDAPFQEKYRQSHRELTAKMRSEERPTDHNRLFGSNMAITRSAWHKVRNRASLRDDIFEDLDIALCLHEAGLGTALIPGADAQISARRFLSPPISQIRYNLCDQRTYLIHGMHKERRSAIVTMLSISLPFYCAMYIPFRAYDASTDSFSMAAFRDRGRLTVRAHT